MKKTKYTFLLPAYKAAFFREALTSIQNQTFKDFKVLVSDDCSPEDLESIFKRAVGNDPRFTFRRNAENMGSKSLVSHWNLLIDMCDTEYLVMASDDDIYDTRFLEKCDQLVTRYPNVDLFRSRARRITAQGEPYIEDLPVNEYDTLIDYLYQTYNCPRIHCIANYLFRTEALNANGKFVNLPLAWFSDDATTMICAEQGVCNTQEILFSFRDSEIHISNESATNQLNAKYKIKATKQFYDWFCLFYNKHYCDSTTLNKNKWELIKSGVRGRVFYLSIPYFSKIKFMEMKALYSWLDNHDFFIERRKRFEFICIWIKSSF